MGNYISILPEILLLVMMTSAFVITFLAVLKIVKQTGLFHGKTAFVASLLISASAVAGCAQLLIMPNNITEAEHTRNITVNYSLLPALTLTGVIVMLQLFIIAATTGPDIRQQSPSRLAGQRRQNQDAHKLHKSLAEKEKVRQRQAAPPKGPQQLKVSSILAVRYR